jgi:BMFP domain-containing protein YqiC
MFVKAKALPVFRAEDGGALGQGQGDKSRSATTRQPEQAPIHRNPLASGHIRPYLSPEHGRHRLPKIIDTRGGQIMTTGANRILDDFAKLMTDAAGAAQGVRKEAETVFRAQAERFMNGMDLVKREEFEAVREMAIKARDENDALLKRIEALEARLNTGS